MRSSLTYYMKNFDIPKLSHRARFFLDGYGVLIHRGYSYWNDKLTELTGISERDAIAQIQRTGLWNEWQIGNATSSDVMEYLLKRSGYGNASRLEQIDRSVIEFRRHTEENLFFDRNVLLAILSLGETFQEKFGVEVDYGINSDQPDIPGEVLRRRAQDNGILKFSQLVISYNPEVRSVKAQRPYTRRSSYIHHTPGTSEIVYFIDDSLRNIANAIKFGMEPIHVNPANSAVKAIDTFIKQNLINT